MQRPDRKLSALGLVRVLVHTTIDQFYSIKLHKDMKNLFIGVDFSKEKVDVAIIFAAKSPNSVSVYPKTVIRFLA